MPMHRAYDSNIDNISLDIEFVTFQVFVKSKSIILIINPQCPLYIWQHQKRLKCYLQQ